MPLPPVGKMWNQGMMSAVRSDWATPRSLFLMLDAEFHFTLDACCTQRTRPNPDIEIIDGDIVDSLTQEWKPATPGAVYVNPPYGRVIGTWVEKAARQSRVHQQCIVMLLPARTDTQWFHEYCIGKAEIRFLRGRLGFDDIGGRGRAPFPSMIVIFGGYA